MAMKQLSELRAERGEVRKPAAPLLGARKSVDTRNEIAAQLRRSIEGASQIRSRPGSRMNEDLPMSPALALA